MSRFNTATARMQARSPVTSEAVPSGKTYEGAPGYARDARSELFLLAVSHLGSDSAFYETGKERDARFADLVRQVAVDDPAWMDGFVPWLRGEANMRTASLVAAAEALKARLGAKLPGGRKLVSAALQRADEPGELLAYWHSFYGRNEPKPLKRGIADAIVRLYSEFSLLKYDTDSHGYRFADVIERVHVGGEHPEVKGTWKGALYEYAIDRRHGRDNPVPEALAMIRANAALRKQAADNPAVLLDAAALKAAGMTWEDALSLAGSKVAKRDLWACVAEGTPVWLPDGRVVPVEQVVRDRLPVLSYDREWDMREPAPGRPYPSRDQGIGSLVPTEPTAWLDNGEQDVYSIRLASGRVIEATAEHRWAVRTRDGARRPLWRTTSQIQPGWAVPVALDAGYFGSLGDEHDGWFIGSMLGDGSMTGHTPVWTGQDDGTLAAVREYAAKHGCSVKVSEQPGCVRAHISDPAWHQNAVRDELIAHGVWGLRVERKALSDLPYSRAFVLGVLAGLIDSDGSVTSKGIEFAVISERLARQFAGLLLRVGVLSILDIRPDNGNFPLWRVRVADSASVRRLADLVDLRGERKAAALARLRARSVASRRTAAGWRGYPDTIAWDRVVSVTPAGRKRTYCVTVNPSHLWVANGVVTGNCLIPSMGFMAQLRNLRNFDDAGVPDEVAGDVIARLTDPEQVARSRQFPFRFLSAYRAAPSLRWAYPLERALNLSLANVPALKGRTLILVDRSLSMWEAKMSGRSGMLWADAAAVFGAAVARRAEHADLVEFASRPAVVKFGPAESVLKIIERFHVGNDQNGPVGTGTDIPRAVRDHLRADHSRVVIVTDEQSEPGVLPSNVWGGYYRQPDAMPPTRIDDLIPQSVPVYVWNIGGYKHGHMPSSSGSRHTFGGLTDHAFRMIPLLEAGRDCAWPWADKAS